MSWPPSVYGTEEVADILKEAGMMPAERKSSEERVREMRDRDLEGQFPTGELHSCGQERGTAT